MPMNPSPVILHAVLDGDRDGVAPVSNNGWPRVLIVYQQAVSVAIAIRIACGIGDLPIEFPCDSRCWPFGVEVCCNAEPIAPARARQSSVLAR